MRVLPPCAPQVAELGKCRQADTLRIPATAGPPKVHPRRRAWSCGTTATGLALLRVLLIVSITPLVYAQPLLDAETERLLVDAVEAAAELDLYNARCRNDVSGRRTDNLNKELVSKFRMTVLEVEDDLFPERSYPRAKERMQRDFLAALKQAGGCKEAKKAGIPERLRDRYEDLLGEIDRQP